MSRESDNGEGGRNAKEQGWREGYDQGYESGASDWKRTASDLSRGCAQMQGEIANLKEKLELARAYVHANGGGWCREGIGSAEVLERTAFSANNGSEPR